METLVAGGLFALLAMVLSAIVSYLVAKGYIKDAARMVKEIIPRNKLEPVIARVLEEFAKELKKQGVPEEKVEKAKQKAKSK